MRLLIQTFLKKISLSGEKILNIVFCNYLINGKIGSIKYYSRKIKLFINFSGQKLNFLRLYLI